MSNWDSTDRTIDGLNNQDTADLNITNRILIDGNAGSTQFLYADGTGIAEWKTFRPTDINTTLSKITNAQLTSDSITINGVEIDLGASGSIPTQTLTATTPLVITGDNMALDYDATLTKVSDELRVAKVPNALTSGTNITFSSGTTYDGSSAITINATDTNTTYTAGDGLELDGTTFDAKVDEDTIDFNGSDEMEVKKVPNNLTAGTNITFSSGTTYDGSSAITINATDTNTTYAGGNNISIDTSANPDEIDLDASITSMTSIAFKTDSTTTSITGNTTANKQTAGTYLDLTQDTNCIAPYTAFDVYDPSTADWDTLTTSYVDCFSGNISQQITAKSTAYEIQVQIYNYTSTSGRILSLQLVGAGGTEWSSDTNEGGYGTGTRSTSRETTRPDETDKQIINMAWYVSGLTAGNNYTFKLQAKTSGTSNYIVAGGTYPACIMRIIGMTTSGGGGGA